jgi:hypothetical protein
MHPACIGTYFCIAALQGTGLKVLVTIAFFKPIVFGVLLFALKLFFTDLKFVMPSHSQR